MTPSTYRFSLQSPDAPDVMSWTQTAQRAEDAGFYSLSVPDHLGETHPQLAPLIALSVAAAVTTRLRLAMTVLDNDFRHPIMLAKEIATLDLLSNGRVDLGLGAGWLKDDYTKTGVATWDAPAIRMRRLIESITVLRALFSGDAVEHAGEFYSIHDYRSYPRPLQDPVPLMIGARGKRMLSFAAREAQVVSVLATDEPGSYAPQFFEGQLRSIVEAGGLERDDLTIGVRVPFGEITSPGGGRAAAERYAAWLKISPDDVIESPYALVGDLDEVREQLLTIRERFGVSYITVSEPFGWDLEPLIKELGTQGGT